MGLDRGLENGLYVVHFNTDNSRKGGIIIEKRAKSNEA